MVAYTLPDLLPYPESGDHTRLWEHFQALADAVQNAIGGDTGWLPLTLNAAWDEGTVAPEYRVIRGTVYLRGQVERPSGSVADIGTLPVGARPTVASPMLVREGSVALNLGLSTGGVLSAGSGYTNGNAVYLNGITFRAD